MSERKTQNIKEDPQLREDLKRCVIEMDRDLLDIIEEMIKSKIRE